MLVHYKQTDRVQIREYRVRIVLFDWAKSPSFFFFRFFALLLVFNYEFIMEVRGWRWSIDGVFFFLVFCGLMVIWVLYAMNKYTHSWTIFSVYKKKIVQKLWW